MTQPFAIHIKNLHIFDFLKFDVLNSRTLLLPRAENCKSESGNFFAIFCWVKIPSTISARTNKQRDVIQGSIDPAAAAAVVLVIFPGLHFGWSPPHSQHMSPGNIWACCSKHLWTKYERTCLEIARCGLSITYIKSLSVTHHCVYQEGDGFRQHVVVFGRDLGPAKESIQLVQGGHLARRSKERRGKIPGRSWPLSFSGQTCLREGELVSVFHPGVPPKTGAKWGKEILGRTYLWVKILLPALYTRDCFSVA